ncbi:hypothetical protein ABT294_16900 [Nonomuraea sp. NPDC000554]|uniref:hypothetical protein n=1 Tax=Nonomuraea sp. NPDC000554 TaxID=3154259 RepID=UPI003327B787
MGARLRPVRPPTSRGGASPRGPSSARPVALRAAGIHTPSRGSRRHPHAVVLVRGFHDPVALAVSVHEWSCGGRRRPHAVVLVMGFHDRLRWP